MRISPPDASAARAQAADWVELNTIASERRGYGQANLLGALDLQDHAQELIEDEGEQLEDEILESKYDDFVEDVLVELEWRQASLGDLYPFAVARAGSGWKLENRRALTSRSRAGHATYRLCLLIAALRYGFLQGEPAGALIAAAPKAFQILVALVSRGLLGGSSSFWFGFPRPEHDGFAQALNRLVGELGVGAAKDQPPPSLRGSTQDAGIDVITWRSFRDGRPTPILSYGQVASGNDWRNKSVEATLDSHFHRWLVDRPAKNFLPAMYIPFMQHESVRARHGASFDVVLHDALVVLESRLGVVIDRVRLTELAPTALAQASAADYNHFREALRWAARVAYNVRRAAELSAATDASGRAG